VGVVVLRPEGQRVLLRGTAGAGGTGGAGGAGADAASAVRARERGKRGGRVADAVHCGDHLCGTTRGRQVDEDFIQDDFNLCSLATQVTYYNYALGTWGGESRRGRGFDVRSALVPSLSGLRVALARPRGPCADTILDVDIPEGELDERQQELVEVSAETLYGLIHARFILTARGMHAMLSKYTDGAFGRCPRVYCNGQTVLPVGQSDVPRCSTVKIFCPMCFDLFFPYVCRRPSSTRRSRSGRKRPSSTDAAVPPAPLLATFPRPAGA
jgi:hypothetical protein